MIIEFKTTLSFSFSLSLFKLLLALSWLPKRATARASIATSCSIKICGGFIENIVVRIEGQSKIVCRFVCVCLSNSWCMHACVDILLQLASYSENWLIRPRSKDPKITCHSYLPGDSMTLMLCSQNNLFQDWIAWATAADLGWAGMDWLTFQQDIYPRKWILSSLSPTSSSCGLASSLSHS